MAAEALRPNSAGRWLAIVGVGEDGLAGLGEAAKRAIAGAEVVFGGRRHLALVGEAVTGEARPWPSPFDTEAVAALAGRSVCVVASGDPFLHGVGATLARSIPAEEMLVFPAPSAFSLAAARLGWPLATIETVSLHGKAVDLIRPQLHPGRRLIALTSDRHGPSAVAALLVGAGFGGSAMTVMEALGGVNQRIRSVIARNFDLVDLNDLNVVAIEVAAAVDARILPRAAGLPDTLFEHDGQITKREIRAVVLSSLAPRRGELLWDVGAGAGSVAVEWMLADTSLQAIAIEANAERAARIRRNARACGVPGLGVVEANAPQAFAGLAPPDAVFIGGGGSEMGVLDGAMAALKPGGRLVANAVTLEMEAVLIGRYETLGGELVRLSVARAAPVGTMTGWKPAMPVTQWAWTKP